MAKTLNRLLRLPIRWQLGIIALVLAFPAVFVIVNSGLRAREEAFQEARSEAQKLAGDIALTQQNLVAAAQQLLTVLAQMPEVRGRDAERTRAIFANCLAVNRRYSNLFVADVTGHVWASGVSNATFDVSDRRYFLRAVQTGRLASGEYVVSRATGGAAFNLGYPLRDAEGRVTGIIGIGFDLERYREFLEFAQLTPGTSYLLLDHAGVIVGRGHDPHALLGQHYERALLDRMIRGPDKDAVVARSMAGDARLIAYEKLRLPGDETPYMYVRVGIPLETVVATANAAMISNLSVFVPSLLLALLLAVAFAKRGIADRTTQLQRAAERVAAGDSTVAVADTVIGGELGSLAASFDDMARQIAERERARRLSEQLYRQLFEVVSDALFLIERDTGRILEVNPAATRLLGYSRQELLEQGNPELLADVGAAAGGAEGAAALLERTHRRKDGSAVPCETAAVEFTWGGRAVALIALRDISSRKAAEEEHRSLAEQLTHAQKMESVGRLAGGVAHDFNNMLSVIVAHAAFLAERLSADDPLRVEVEQIADAATRSANLTRQLLTFARKQPVAPTVIDLEKAVPGTVKLLQRLVGEDVTLSWSAAPGLWRIRIDPAQLDQIFTNLCVNARDAIADVGRIRITAENRTITGSGGDDSQPLVAGDYVRVSVADDGSGMDPGTLAHVFEPFFTTKEAGQGTGLGLATVYGIVKQNGGAISVRSARGEGTTFTIDLPRCLEVEAAPIAAPANQPIAQGGKRILLVEDEAAVLAITERILRRRGYTVVSTSRPTDALRLAREQAASIDLLLTDVILPELNGHELARRVKHAIPDVKVLFMSGYTADIVAAKGLVDDSFHIVSKPFLPDELCSKVVEIIGPGAPAGAVRPDPAA